MTGLEFTRYEEGEMGDITFINKIKQKERIYKRREEYIRKGKNI